MELVSESSSEFDLVEVVSDVGVAEADARRELVAVVGAATGLSSLPVSSKFPV